MLNIIYSLDEGEKSQRQNTSHQYKYIKFKGMIPSNVGENVEKFELSYRVDGKINWHNCFGKLFSRLF